MTMQKELLAALQAVDQRWRVANEADGDELFALHVAAMKGPVSSTWDWDLADQLSRFQAAFRPTQVYVLPADDGISCALEATMENACMRLVNIKVHPRHQRNGIGTMIIDILHRLASYLEVPLSLQVLRTNPDAIKLYRRLGFNEVRRTPTHVVMERAPEAPSIDLERRSKK